MFNLSRINWMEIIGINPDQTISAQPQSELDRIRFPVVISTDGYLDDPIEFEADPRFQPRSAVQQLPKTPDQVKRDYAEFLQIDRNNDALQELSINMFSDTTNRVNYEKVIGPRAQFTQLGVTK